MDAGVINVVVRASDEASRVIDKVRKSTRGGTTGSPTGALGSSSGGMGLVNAASSVFLLGQIAKIGKASLDKLTEASPMLAAQLKMMDIAVNRFLRPLGDSLARAMMPMTDEAIKKAEEQAEVLERIDEEFGPIGTLLGTIGFGIADIQKGFLELIYNTSLLKPLVDYLIKPLADQGKAGEPLSNLGSTTDETGKLKGGSPGQTFVPGTATGGANPGYGGYPLQKEFEGLFNWLTGKDQKVTVDVELKGDAYKRLGVNDVRYG